MTRPKQPNQQGPTSALKKAPDKRNDSGKTIDSPDKDLHTARVIPIEHVREAVHDQFSSDHTEIGQLEDEMRKLRSSYMRYLDLIELSQQRRERLSTLGGLLAGSDKADKAMLSDAVKERELNAAEFRAKPTLWKAIKEIVRLVHEIQMVDLEFVLRSFGINVARPSIDSALETHEDVFRVVSRGREKYVTLK